MPWLIFRWMSDDDIEALYAYIRAVPAISNVVPDDNKAGLTLNVPSISGSYDVERQNYARFCASNTDCNTGESCASATSECVGKACSVDSDCDACQTCTASACAAPLPDSACLAGSR